MNLNFGEPNYRLSNCNYLLHDGRTINDSSLGFFLRKKILFSESKKCLLWSNPSGMDFESLQTIKKSSLLLLHIISIMFFGSWPNKNLITQRISAALGKKNRVKVAVFIGCGLNGSWYSLSFNCCVLKEVCWLIIWKVSFHTTHSLLLCNIVSRLEPFFIPHLANANYKNRYLNPNNRKNIK